MSVYISRTLIVDKGTANERSIDESEISSISSPIIVLGEPGIGKTALTKNLETKLSGKRIAAGTFARSENLEPYSTDSENPLIIDGLDEVSASFGKSSLDLILKKLDQLGHPKFIISCRAADWQGSSDRWKIEQDYRSPPITLHIVPLSNEQAASFLAGYNSGISPPALLDEIEKRGLQELVGNPLTLGLLAEVSLEGKGLPESRTKLLEQASHLLVKERNPAHANSPMSMARIDDLLISAGAITAHLLISNNLGVSTSPQDNMPEGFIHSSDLTKIGDASRAEQVLNTRLFRSEGEGLFVPIHRVLAEFLGARWLSRRLHVGLSKRRLFQALEFSGGIPTALRGLYAWLGYFAPSVADRCIRTDPYGVLRYGETNQLPTAKARLLLSSLASLANEDPYFRSEDWGTRAVSGLARVELKDDIISVVRSPDRHFHLSSLLLEALPGTTLAREIVPELVEIITDGSSAYVERSHAAEALISSRANVDWASLVANLQIQTDYSDKRLAIEIISFLKGDGFTPKQIADALVELHGIEEIDQDSNHISGVDYFLIRQLSPEQCTGVLDGVSERIAETVHPPHWSPNHELSTAIQRLAAKALWGFELSAERFWSWFRFVDVRTSYSTDAKDQIAEYLKKNPDFKRAIQRVALDDTTIDGGPWMTIVSELPQTNPALSITAEDADLLLNEIASFDTLSDAHITLWTDLVRALGRREQHTEGVTQAIHRSTDKHPELALKWVELTKPPQRDWEKEHELRQKAYLRKQEIQFKLARTNFAKIKEEIATCKALGALQSLALGYLNRYSELDRDAAPFDRLRHWVGNDNAEAASKGFIAYLSRTDVPTINKIVELRNEGKLWSTEPIITCGVTELIRTGQSLEKLSEEVARSALIIWWDMPEFNSTKLGEEVEKQLEARVFHSNEATEKFLVAAIEPPIRAGKEHISGLYNLSRDPRFRRFAAALALRWLKACPNASLSVQLELLEICLHQGSLESLAEVVTERLSAHSVRSNEAHDMWLAAAFVLNLSNYRAQIIARSENDKKFLWSIKGLIRPDRDDRNQQLVEIAQREFIVEKFAPHWPLVTRPPSGWRGDESPWGATDYINSCIDAIGADPSTEASDALNRLAQCPATAPYAEHLKHVRAQQRRLRRDKEYVPPSFDQLKITLASGPPGTIDDLKAVMVDALMEMQAYVRNSDTNNWEAYWNGNLPKDENTCRDRALDTLRPLISKEVALLPESLMPEKKRTDIIAIHNGKGLPIEFKGQWHDEIWEASKTQLDDNYTRDWRADGRGIYVVLWFGPIARKLLWKHPEGLPAPTTPHQLQKMLLNQLDENEKSRIDIVVLDVSKPPTKK